MYEPDLQYRSFCFVFVLARLTLVPGARLVRFTCGVAPGHAAPLTLD